MHLYNDIKKADVTVSNTTLDVGTSTVKMKNVTFADNSTLSLKINGFDDSEHGLLNVSDSLTIADSASAWVDSASFAKGSISADVADKLADLAQNDATGLVEVVKTLAQQKPQLCKRLLPWCLSRQLPRTHWNA